MIFIRRLLSGTKLRLNGALSDTPDPRDRDIAMLALAKDIPSSFTIDKGQAPDDQDGTGSCCGQGAQIGAWLAYQALGVDVPRFSALFAYYNARRYHQSSSVQDTGTAVRHAVKALQQFGVCPASTYPMIPNRVNRKPTWNAYKFANKHHGVRGYYTISPGDVDAWRRAIAARKPVIAWWEIDKAFTATFGPDVIGPCDLNQKVGNHCMCVPTYHANGNFDLLNSWGLWRRNGRQRVTEEFIARARNPWVIDVIR